MIFYACTYVYIIAHFLPKMTEFLLMHKGTKFILTEWFNQDSLEFFVQQRAKGQHNDNLSVAQFMENSHTLGCGKITCTWWK